MKGRHKGGPRKWEAQRVHHENGPQRKLWPVFGLPSFLHLLTTPLPNTNTVMYPRNARQITERREGPNEDTDGLTMTQTAQRQWERLNDCTRVTQQCGGPHDHMDSRTTTQRVEQPYRRLNNHAVSPTTTQTADQQH